MKDCGYITHYCTLVHEDIEMSSPNTQAKYWLKFITQSLIRQRNVLEMWRAQSFPTCTNIGFTVRFNPALSRTPDDLFGRGVMTREYRFVKGV